MAPMAAGLFFLTNFVIWNMLKTVFLYISAKYGYPLKYVLKDVGWMIEGYLTIKEMAEKWGVTRRRVQTLCSEGRIPGATRFGNEWAIPADTVRPTDGRVTTGEYRNWRKKMKKITRMT